MAATTDSFSNKKRKRRSVNVGFVGRSESDDEQTSPPKQVVREEMLFSPLPEKPLVMTSPVVKREGRKFGEGEGNIESPLAVKQECKRSLSPMQE